MKKIVFTIYFIEEDRHWVLPDHRNEPLNILHQMSYDNGN